MANSRLPVPAPAKSALGHGLVSVVENRGDAPALRGHWKSGIEWQNVCPDANTTYDECVQGNALGAAAPAEPVAKAATASRSRWGATPFTVFAEIDCSPPGFWDNVDEIVSQTFTEAEAFEVENVFFSGTVGAVTGLAYPHLAAAVGLVDGPTTLQLVAANVGPTGALDVVEALGKLEAALATCVKGVGVIHVPAELLPHLAANWLITERDGVFYSPAGHKFAVGAGYSGAGPNGLATAGVQWLYGTGPVFMYQSRGTFLGDRTDSLNRSVDTEKRIYERTYLLGYDCCLFGVPVSTGGVITGTPGSAS